MNIANRYRFYVPLLIALVLPVFLVRVFPNEASNIRTLVTLMLFPIVCGALMIEALRPLFEWIKGLPSTTFTADLNHTITYSIVRTLLLLASVASFVILVVPMWRGAFLVYILKQTPQTITGTIDSQGSGLTVPFFNTSIHLKGSADQLIWLYGNFLQPNATYTLSLLPQSNVVLDVIPVTNTPATTP